MEPYGILLSRQVLIFMTFVSMISCVVDGDIPESWDAYRGCPALTEIQPAGQLYFNTQNEHKACSIILFPQNKNKTKINYEVCKNAG